MRVCLIPPRVILTRMRRVNLRAVGGLHLEVEAVAQGEPVLKNDGFDHGREAKSRPTEDVAALDAAGI